MVVRGSGRGGSILVDEMDDLGRGRCWGREEG